MNLTFKQKSYFLFTATFFGLIYVFIIPPFQSPDESSHYFRAIHLSNGQLFGKKENQRLGGNINESHFLLKKEFYDLRFNKGKIHENKFKKALSFNKNEFGSHFVDFPNTSYYSPTVYLPQVFGCLIGKKINNSLIFFYLIRLVTLLFWIIIIYVSLEKIPFHKWTFTFLALLPSSIFLHSSISGDTITNALSYLLVALILKKVVSRPQQNYFFFMFIVLLLTTIILLNKIIYFPLVGLVLLIPSDSFYGKGQKNVWISSLFALIFLIFIGWFSFTKNQFLSFDEYNPLYRSGLQLNEGVNPTSQFTYVLRNPLIFIKTVIISYWETKAATLAHFAGKFGWEKNYLSSPIIGILLILLLLNAIFEKSKSSFKMTNKIRAYLIGIATIMTAGLTLLMYLHWNPVGSDRITNLSGRYFIPILPLVFLALMNDRYQLTNHKLLVNFTCVFIWIALSSGVWCVLQRYWI